MTPIKVPSNLPEVVRSAFNKAVASGDVTHYATQVVVLTVNSIPFQLRFSPALANKPKPPPRPTTTDTKPFDPFDNPAPPMLVCPLGGHDDDPPSHSHTHNLVLNKFAVVPEHFILATRAHRPQTHLLEADDLAATYACIEAYARQGRQQLFAFFNSGEHSGASQPHRHVQLLPVERMRDGLSGRDGGWDVLADRIPGEEGAGRSLPFGTYAERLHDGVRDAEGKWIHRVYLRLYRRACQAVGVELGAQEEADLEEGRIPAGDAAEARISYNLGMTRDTFVLCPRRSEGARLTGKDGGDVGMLALNGTVLAGTALVKNEAEWDALRADPAQLGEVLGRIGYPCG